MRKTILEDSGLRNKGFLDGPLEGFLDGPLEEEAPKLKFIDKSLKPLVSFFLSNSKSSFI